MNKHHKRKDWIIKPAKIEFGWIDVLLGIGYLLLTYWFVVMLIRMEFL